MLKSRLAAAAAAALALGSLAVAAGVELDCPAVSESTPGGWAATTDAAGQQEAAAAAWAALVATNAIQLPMGSVCQVDNATITPVSACSQVVAGVNRIVAFTVDLAGACPYNLTVKANTFMPLGENATLELKGSAVAISPSDEAMNIPVYEQCGGSGGDCGVLSVLLGLAPNALCDSEDWPNTMCADGSECFIHSVYYRQCAPSAVKLSCPPVENGTVPLPGGYSPNTNVTAQTAVASAVWANMTATNLTSLPNGTKCDTSSAVVTPISACSQVVAGTNYVLKFNVTFPGSCPLYTTVDANVFAPLNASAPPVVNGMRVAPYKSSSSYQSCTLLPNGKEECQTMLVFPLWGQCGGSAGDCAQVAEMAGSPAAGYCYDGTYPYSECAYGGTCTRATEYYYQCKAV